MEQLNYFTELSQATLPHALKGQKLLAQGNALKGQKLLAQGSALKGQKLLAQGNALKGQKLLAQGNALGIVAVSKAPCKGKSLINCLVL